MSQPAEWTDPAGTLGANPATKIEVRSLNFFYGRQQALKDITLALPDRSITAFIGPQPKRPVM